mgnify:CR=1 FL=1
MRVISAVKNFLRSDDATTAVEYAVLLALILVAGGSIAHIFVGRTSDGSTLESIEQRCPYLVPAIAASPARSNTGSGPFRLSGMLTL